MCSVTVAVMCEVGAFLSPTKRFQFFVLVGAMFIFSWKYLYSSLLSAP